MSIYLKSRIFVQKFHLLNEDDQNDVNRAMNRVTVDPENNQFKRDYISPYRQEHPANKQLTLFFEYIKPEKKVFFVWLNDYSCLHDTHKKHGDDPCLKEFIKIRTNGRLENFNHEFHEGKLVITPRESDPHFFRFTSLDLETFGNILNDSATYYCMSLTWKDHRNDDDANLVKYHLSQLLVTIKDHFKKNKQKFELRLPYDFNQEIIDWILDIYDSQSWTVEEDEDDDLFYLKLDT